MRVRLKTDLSGLRDGVPWPPAGSELDVPESEAASLIASGLAEKPREGHDTVQVPPSGVHTPKDTGVREAPAEALTVEAPADAVTDPGQVPDEVKQDATAEQAAQLTGEPDPAPARPTRPARSSSSKAAAKK